jgi:hypothetical protein
MCHRATCHSTDSRGHQWKASVRVNATSAHAKKSSHCSSSKSVCVWPQQQQQQHRSGACLLGSTLLPLMFLSSSLLCRRLHLDSTVHGSSQPGVADGVACLLGLNFEGHKTNDSCCVVPATVGGSHKVQKVVTSTTIQHLGWWDASIGGVRGAVSKWPHTRGDTHPLTHSLPTVSGRDCNWPGLSSLWGAQKGV